MNIGIWVDYRRSMKLYVQWFSPQTCLISVFFFLSLLSFTLLLLGYILDQTNSYQMAFLFAGCIGLMPCILLIINHIIWNYCIIDERWPPKANHLVQKKNELDKMEVWQKTCQNVDKLGDMIMRIFTNIYASLLLNSPFPICFHCLQRRTKTVQKIKHAFTNDG